MKYRPFGKLDFQVSALGFGCMRLPMTDANDSGSIDEPEATRMVRYAIDHGVNYIDTAYPYHNEKSEEVVGRILQGGYRGKVRLATKLPMWAIEQQDDCDRILDEQLRKLQTDHIDFYLLHALNRERWALAQQLKILEWAEKAKADGRIRHLGFSFHDLYPIFEEIVTGSDQWEFCQIQFNYMDLEVQAGLKGLKLAAERGLAIVIMEPLLGGTLADPPDQILSLFDESHAARTPADWALQWLWSRKEVSVVLSGMSAMEQVVENVESANHSGVGLLTKEDEKIITEVRQTFEKIYPIPCTKCEYCMPCPNGVDIPRNFETYNRGVMLSNWGQARMRYGQIPEDMRASECIACLECEPKCPQSIKISDWMPIVHGVCGEEKDYEPDLRP